MNQISESTLHAQTYTNETVQPLFSIISICWNEEPKRIRETFDSIYAQTYPRVEHIVVDGNSAQPTRQALDGYVEQMNRFLSEPDKGVYDAMNKGIELASGDFILFLNIGDRFVDADVLQKMAAFIQAHPSYDYYYGNALRLRGDALEFAAATKRITKLHLYEATVCHQSVLARRTLFTEIGSFDLQYKIIADREWILRALLHDARGQHSGVTGCIFELGGLSSDGARRAGELQRMQKQHYSQPERALYGTIWFLRKVVKRIRQRNFKLPRRLAAWLPGKPGVSQTSC